MKIINSFTCFVLLTALVGGLPVGYAAEDTSWSIDSRILPAPVAASDELRNAISNMSTPDLVQASNEVSREGLIAMIGARNSGQPIDLDALGRATGVSIAADTINGVTVYRVMPERLAPEHANHMFLHVHGGGYVFGGGDASVGEAVQIAAAAGIPAISVDYRMPPESPFPAALDDTIVVYRAMLESRQAGEIAIGGTSAGAGLALAAVHQMKELGLPVPGALFAGTPWADLTKTGDTLYSNEGIDRVLVSYDGWLKSAAYMYADGRDLTDPLISPMYGNFDSFPPTILVSGTRDMLLSDTARVQRKLRDAGVIADLHVFEGLSHAGYLMLPQAQESISTFGELSLFLKEYLD